MDTCNLKWLFVVICIIIVVTGLFLAFQRERKSINSGTIEAQDGSGSLKDGSIAFKFAIGLVLILIGLVGGYFSIQNLPGCDIQNQRESQDSSKDVQGDKVQGDKVQGDKVQGDKVQGDKIQGNKTVNTK